MRNSKLATLAYNFSREYNFSVVVCFVKVIKVNQDDFIR